MEVFSVETFQYDWQNKKVVSQYILVESRDVAKKIVDEAVKEYEGRNRKVELAMDDLSYIYRITVPGVDGLVGEDEFFIGCIERHVNTQSDLDMMMSQWEKVKKS